MAEKKNFRVKKEFVVLRIIHPHEKASTASVSRG